MKFATLTKFLLMLALIAFGSSLSRKQPTATPEVQHYGYADLFRGSEAGKTLDQACGNCHSNQTNLPWYGHVIPISWWIKGHVHEGRQALNFSDWTTYSLHHRLDELQSICGVVSNGSMPPASYRAVHPESRLKAQDKNVICAWAANESEHQR
jgi:hypothetical protein